MSHLDGRVAVITGGGRGLGREHALLLAKLGCNVIVNDIGSGLHGDGRDSAPAEQVAEEIRSAGGHAVAHIGGVSDWHAAKNMIDTAIHTFGRLDILVNNAGILRDRTLVNMSEADWDSVIEVHLKGHFCALRHAADYWRSESKRGRNVTASVINTTSGSGLRGNPGQSNYASAKAAIAALTVVAARELQRYGVRVNAIAPVARTRMTLATPGMSDRMDNRASARQVDRFEPANVSPLVAWLATDTCKVSGQVFTSYGSHIDWHEGWSVQKEFETDGIWTVEQLGRALSDLPKGPSQWVGSVSW